jgi:hypothetical protein
MVFPLFLPFQYLTDKIFLLRKSFSLPCSRVLQLLVNTPLTSPHNFPLLVEKTTTSSSASTSTAPMSMQPRRKNNLNADIANINGTSRLEDGDSGGPWRLHADASTTTVSVAATVRVAACPSTPPSADLSLTNQMSEASESWRMASALPTTQKLYENNASIQNSSFVQDLKFNRQVFTTVLNVKVEKIITKLMRF